MNENANSNTNPTHARLWFWTIAGLCLNGLILLLILAGIVHHHHEMKMQEHFARDGRGGGQEGHRGEWGSRGFHHHFGPWAMNRGGWGRGEGGYGPRPWGNEGMRQGREGFGPGGPGVGRFGPRGGPRGPGFDAGNRGMPGGQGPGGFHPGQGWKMGQAPDPAVLTDMVLGHLAQQLTLTDDQKAKIKPIVQQFVQQMDEQRQAFEKQIEAGKAKIRPLLNADQQKQLDQLPIPGQKPAAPGK